MKGKTKKGKGKSLWLLAAGILLALPLFGWGCTQQPVAGPQQPTVNQDAGSKIPEGWKVYESQAGVTMVYPDGWFIQEDTRYSGIVNINLNPTPLPPIETEADVFPALTLTIEDGLVPFDKAQWNLEEEESVLIDGQQAQKGKYHSQLLDNEEVVVYWWQSQNKTYTVVGLATEPVTDQFVVALMTTMGKE